MKKLMFPVTCDVCGGDGVGTLKTHLANWSLRPGVISHDDPSVCIENLRTKEKAQKTQQVVCA